MASAPVDEFAHKLKIKSSPKGRRVITSGLFGAIGGGALGYVATGLVLTTPVAWCGFLCAGLYMAYTQLTDEHSDNVDDADESNVPPKS